MQFVFVDYIPGSTTPARVYRSTGVVLINRSRFDHLPDFTKKFILKHEEGHYKLNTTDEFKADEYASNALLLTEPGSLKNSIKALDNVLPKSNIQQKMRIREQVKRALKADGNLEALKNLIEMENNYEGTLIGSNNEAYGSKMIVPNFYNTFYDIQKSNKVNAQTEFLNRSVLESLGFKKEVPKKFIQKINETDNSPQVYEIGKTIPGNNTKNDATPAQPEPNEKILETEDIKLSLAENAENTEKNIQVHISNPLFYYLLGVISILLLALIINLFKD